MKAFLYAFPTDLSWSMLLLFDGKCHFIRAGSPAENDFCILRYKKLFILAQTEDGTMAQTWACFGMV